MSEPVEDRIQEEARLRHVLEIVDQQIEKYSQQLGLRKQEVQDIRKNFWDEVTVNMTNDTERLETMTSIQQEARLLAEREHSQGHSERLLRLLYRMEDSPYFGRVDFKESGLETESIYIGLTSLLEQDGETFLVYDWRAPVSSMFYDYSPGPAQYMTPQGEAIQGEMELKRQYVIRQGKLQNMFDTDLTIGDSLLQAALSQQSSEQMKSIVATIQKEQNRIIRNDHAKLLLVQGAAGSGKTSAALQRIAYLLYKYRGRLEPDQIVLFSPNPLFSNYVSNVLPELGEANMKQLTFQQILHERIGSGYEVESLYDQTEALYELDQEGSSLRKKMVAFKSSTLFFELLDTYIKHLSRQGIVFKPLRFKGRTVVSEQEMSGFFYSTDATLPMHKRLSLFKNWLHEQLKAFEQDERKKKWVGDAIELLDEETYNQAYRRLRKKGSYTDESFDDDKKLRAYLRTWVVKQKTAGLRRRIDALHVIDIDEIYVRLWTDYLPGMPGMPYAEDMVTDTVEHIRSKQIRYEDAAPYLYLKEAVLGFPSMNSGVKHLIVDEGQDYSPFQYAFFREMFPGSKMTVLGDLNQSIFHQSGVSHFYDQLPEWVGLQDAERLKLTKTYRSTKPIIEFSKCFLDTAEDIEPFERSGRKPVLVQAANEEQLMERLVRDAVQAQQNGLGTIGILCKTRSESLKLQQLLKDRLEVQLIDENTAKLPAGVLLMPAYMAKGIEFDSVFVYGATKRFFGPEEGKLLYTICTRAMHELRLYAADEVTALMERVPRSLYDLE
ncbi:RNA polymerase recycling motor HelD [Marinicrinis lubricantis]|uniref:RNA polymerase recycling motor HelD n=1 Tax=Marinicrinis lubricantis TaxID=2086470 RepID=A0ABW1IIV2_9BACL